MGVFSRVMKQISGSSRSLSFRSWRFVLRRSLWNIHHSRHMLIIQQNTIYKCRSLEQPLESLFLFCRLKIYWAKKKKTYMLYALLWAFVQLHAFWIRSDMREGLCSRLDGNAKWDSYSQITESVIRAFSHLFYVLEEGQTVIIQKICFGNVLETWAVIMVASQCSPQAARIAFPAKMKLYTVFRSSVRWWFWFSRISWHFMYNFLIHGYVHIFIFTLTVFGKPTEVLLCHDILLHYTERNTVHNAAAMDYICLSRFSSPSYWLHTSVHNYTP